MGTSSASLNGNKLVLVACYKLHAGNGLPAWDLQHATGTRQAIACAARVSHHRTISLVLPLQASPAVPMSCHGRL